MRFFAVVAVLTSALIVSPAHAIVIDSSEITVTGTLCNRCVSYPPDRFPPANTIDGDLSTFWHSENDLRLGEVNELIYRFEHVYDLQNISFVNDYTNAYNMGELAVQYWDGQGWVTFFNIDGDFGRGDFDLLPDAFAAAVPTNGVRLEMTYQGRGAHGGTPAFYLSEIEFRGDRVTVPVPPTLALIGVGLAGLLVSYRHPSQIRRS